MTVKNTNLGKITIIVFIIIFNLNNGDKMKVLKTLIGSLPTLSKFALTALMALTEKAFGSGGTQ